MDHVERRDGKAFAARVALFYGAIFLIYGVHLTYLPVWLDWRGLSSGEIAAIMSAPLFLRLAVTPAAAVLADRTQSHRGVVIAASWACLCFALILTGATVFAAIFVAAVAFHLSSSTIMPLAETVAVRGVKFANLDYGRMRLWGSLTFITIGVVGGALIDYWGPGVAVWLLVLGSAATASAAHFLPRPDPARSEATAEGPHASTGYINADVVRLLRTPVFIVFLLASGIVQGAHGTFYTFGALHWKSQGISTSWVGVLWAVAVLAEVALFAYSRALFERLSPLDFILAGAAAAVVRWGIMTTDPPLVMLVPLQLLHALTFGASHIGAIHFLGRAVPEGAAGTSQALYATVSSGLLIGAVTLGSGAIYDRAGGYVYALPAALGVVSFSLCLWLRKQWSGGVL